MGRTRSFRAPELQTPFKAPHELCACARPVADRARRKSTARAGSLRTASTMTLPSVSM